jgi:hypothetical protein
MDQTYWQRQNSKQPLFADLVWSRPENKTYAGKLLIVGGNLHGFSAPAEAFAAAGDAGIGVARAVLPDSLQRTVGRVFQAGEYAPSTPSGSFSNKALAELLAMASWSDGVLLAGDLGRNSETAIMLESFAGKYAGPLVITKDAVDYFSSTPQPVEHREDTALVLSFSQLQKLAMSLHLPAAFTFDMDILRLVDALHELTLNYPFFIVTKHLDQLFVAVGGDVSSTKLATDRDIWRVATAAHVAVWWLQNQSKPFEALTTGCCFA